MNEHVFDEVCSTHVLSLQATCLIEAVRTHVVCVLIIASLLLFKNNLQKIMLRIKINNLGGTQVWEKY